MHVRRAIAVLCALGAMSTLAYGDPWKETQEEALARIYNHPGPVHIIPRDALPPGMLPTLKVRSSDASMNAAFAEARKSLPAALAATQKDKGWFSPSLALYIAVFVNAPGQPIEFVWVDNIRRKGKGYQGRLAGPSRQLSHGGQDTRIDFLNPQIADWAVQAVDGRYYGYFTTRVRLPGLEDVLAAQLRALLVENPVPALWR